MKRIANILFWTTVWTAAAGYVVYAALLASQQRHGQKVKRVDVHIVDSTATRRLVTQDIVLDWVRRSGVKTVGEHIDAVDAAAIYRTVAGKGLVDRACVYVSTHGTLHIEISQRRPVMRFIGNGYDIYASTEGYVFRTPEYSSLYVPVVTGTYMPPVERGFEGFVHLRADSLRQATDAVVAASAAETERLKELKETVTGKMKKAKKAVDKQMNEDIKARYNRNGSMSEAESRRLRDEWRRIKRDTVAPYARRLADIRSAIIAAEERSAAARERCARESRRYADFAKLIEFAETVSDDSFWGAEIVQIIAEPTFDGGIDLTIIPRSGNFRVVLGGIDDAQSRLDKLAHFYRSGLQNLGWNRYRVINLKYANRVVCTE